VEQEDLKMDKRAEIKIGTHAVGPGHRPFIIAEMSGNHNQSLERALAIVDAAADAGAHGLKIQTYTADTMTLDIKGGDFAIADGESLWKGRNLYQLYQEAHTPWEWHKDIFARARARGMVAFSTPFDETAVAFLESLEVPCYKIASFENTDIPLIERVAATGKPVIMSTGMASVAELHEAVSAATAAGCKDLILLKCTSTYPATPEDSHLQTIPHMRDLFDCQVGLSDHTMGCGVAVAAVTLGATVVEKHFTLARADGGVDSTFSLEPHEMSQLVTETERAWQSLGQVHYGTASAREEKSKQFRRSLYIARDVKAGDVLTPENLRSVRPGRGLATKHLKSLLGRRTRRSAPAGTPLSWDIVD
jgi:pseudaminic acid synthase